MCKKSRKGASNYKFKNVSIKKKCDKEAAKFLIKIWKKSSACFLILCTTSLVVLMLDINHLKS